MAVLVLGVGGLRAQHFEWAKGYSSSQEGNIIKGQVTDSAGNLYILGQFRNTAAWDGGSHLLPMAPYGPVTDVSNVLIAKITPDGMMVWKKVLHANNGIGATAWDIKSVGDTAFACLVRVTLPAEEHYSYYLDTLLNGRGDYPIPNGDMGSTDRTALIMFDFEGNVLEQHFLTLTYIDNEGGDFKYGEWYMNNGYLLNISFDIDKEGNIYICRQAADVADGTHSPWQGNISGIKYWVDGRVVGTSTTDKKPLGWFPQLLKFSPHMDTLLGIRYLVQQCDSVEYQMDNLYIKLDYDGNPYIIGALDMFGAYNNTIIIDSILNIFFSHSPIDISVGFLLKTDTALNPLYVASFKDSIWGTNNLTSSRVVFNNISFDYDSNLVFVSGFVQKNRDANSIYTIDGHPLMFENNDAFFFSLNNTDKEFHSYGIIPSTIASNNYGQQNNLFTLNNRVFMQNQYYGGIVFSDRTIQAPGNDPGLCLTIFDYFGHLIEGVDYSTYHPLNRPGPICSCDSILYLVNELHSNATLGNIVIPAQGYNACIAKYVDTAFMTPYVPPTVHITQADTTTLRLYPNPAHGAVRIDTGGEPVRSAALLTVYGQRTPLQVDGDRVELTDCPAGVYILEITTNNQKYHQKIIIL